MRITSTGWRVEGARDDECGGTESARGFKGVHTEEIKVGANVRDSSTPTHSAYVHTTTIMSTSVYCRDKKEMSRMSVKSRLEVIECGLESMKPIFHGGRRPHREVGCGLRGGSSQYGSRGAAAPQRGGRGWSVRGSSGGGSSGIFT